MVRLESSFEVYINLVVISCLNLGELVIKPCTFTHTLQVVLLDLVSCHWRLDGWRKELWELSHIGIPDNDNECRDAIMFGFLVNWFLHEVREGSGGE